MTGRPLAPQVSGGAFKQAPAAAKGERPSSFFLNCLARCRMPQDAVAVDVACGRGRHIRHLASASSYVIGIDIDVEALRDVHARQPEVLVLQADLRQALPLATSSVSLIAAIHAPMLDLMPEFARVLVPGGRLILESFGGRGENWRNLPAAQELKLAAQPRFAILSYREASVGPADSGRVSAKLLAERRTADTSTHTYSE